MSSNVHPIDRAQRARRHSVEHDAGTPPWAMWSPPAPAPRLTAGDVGKLGLAGLANGVLIGIMLDPAHALRSLLAIVGIGL